MAAANGADPTAQYIREITNGESAIVDEECLSPQERITELWMLGLRLKRGVAPDGPKSSWHPSDRWLSLALNLEQQGLLHLGEEYIALTEAGRLVQDRVTVELIPEQAEA